MKTLIPFWSLLLLLAVGGPAPAVAQGKIATINLRKVFDDYYKTKIADANLKEEAGELDKERKTLMDKYEAMSNDYQQALDQANNQAISADERERRKKMAEAKLLELKDLEGSITQFDRQARSTLEEKQRRMRENILGEIQTTINDLSKLRNFDLVMDTAAETINRTPVVVFSSGANDITDLILKQLNASAPPGNLTPTSGNP